MRNNRGFTLVELIVTLAVLAIIATMAAPSFGNLVAEKRLESDARELALTLGEVRAQATALRRVIILKFQKGTSSSTVFYWTPQYEENGLDDSDINVSFTDVTYTPVGIPSQREVDKPNPAYDKDNPTDLSKDPPINPPTIKVKVPLKFKVCNSRIGKSRIISVSLNGTVQQIEKGECLKNG